MYGVVGAFVVHAKQFMHTRVEIEGSSVTYFDRIAAFEVLYRRAGLISLDIHASTKRV